MILIAVFFVGLAAGMSAAADAALALVGSFALPLLFAMMLGRQLQARFVVHGAVIGGAAFVIFMAINGIGRVFQPDIGPQSVAYWIAHGLKIVGGAIGGAIASRRHRTPV